MRRLLTSIVALAAMLALGMPAVAGPSDGPRGTGSVAPDRPAPWDLDAPSDDTFADDLWFVEFAEPPEARGGSPAAQANERAQLRAQARAQGVRADIERDFGVLWNGVSIRADAEEIAAIRTLPTVETVYPVAVIEAPEPEDVDPDLATALALTGADSAQSELGYTGDGLNVAIIDTGIDYNHPDLGGDGDQTNVITADRDDRTMEHPRITHGWDYVGDEFDPADPNAPQDPDPNDDPMDLHGHGTHVAGIVGADAADEEGATGVAPAVTLGAYKVFGPGSTTADVIVDALEDAFVDGMDVMNMSLGAAFVWGQEYPTTATSNELANQGVVVVNSAGNSGGDGVYSLSAPANAHDIISVASADNTFFDALVFEVEQLDWDIPYNEMSGAEMPPTEGESEEVAWLGRACVDTTDDQLLDDPGGKVALIVRGECTFSEKYLAAADAGATGVVIFNNVAGQFAGTIGDDGIDGVWSVGIGNSDGEALVDLIEDGETVVLGFTDETASLPNPTGGLVSSFSSYGQDVELEFGPTIMAPGGLIRSTWPLARGGYATISGTSMSAPHVAGTVALLLEAHPQLDGFEVRDRLQNTARPTDWSLNPGLGFPDHTFRQGAGMVQIDQAITARQRVTPAQIALGDADETTVTLTVRNDGPGTVRYDVTHSPALETGVSTFTPDFFLFGASVDAPSRITLQSGRSAQVEVTITAPNAGIPNHQYGGYIEFTPNRSGFATLRVPYSGFDGDYPGEMGLLGYWDWPLEDATWSWVDVEPRLSRITSGGSLSTIGQNHVFRPSEGDFPVIEAFFGHFPQEMTVTARNLDTGQTFDALHEEYLRRSPQPGLYWPFVWTATDQEGNEAPVGRYQLEAEFRRALGDADDPEHVETWTSPTFRIGDERGGGPPPGRGPNR